MAGLDARAAVSFSGTPFNPEKLLAGLVSGLEESGKQIKSNFEAATSRWAEPPVFIILNDSKFALSVSSASKELSFVNYGTAVRYAHMQEGYSARSQPDSLSQSGSGGQVAYINTSRPLPGIKARRFDKSVKKLWDSLLPILVQKHLDAAAR